MEHFLILMSVSLYMGHSQGTYANDGNSPTCLIILYVIRNCSPFNVYLILQLNAAISNSQGKQK